LNKLCLTRFFSLFAALFLLHLPAYAQSEAENEPTQVDENVSADTFVPAPNGGPDEFSDPDETLGEIRNIEPPACQSPQFYEKIMSVINQYMEKTPAVSILEKRRKMLNLAEITGFEQISAAEVSPEVDFDTANMILMIKINQKIPQEDILVCRQQTSKKKPLYIVAYPYLDNWSVSIINLRSDTKIDNWISFIYP